MFFTHRGNDADQAFNEFYVNLTMLWRHGPDFA
jgi:hypothetical protein